MTNHLRESLVRSQMLKIVQALAPGSVTNGSGSIPLSLIEVPWLGDIRIPSPSNHKELAVVGFGCHLERFAKVRGQDYVAVRIAENVMARDFVRAVKEVVEMVPCSLRRT